MVSSLRRNLGMKGKRKVRENCFVARKIKYIWRQKREEFRDVTTGTAGEVAVVRERSLGAKKRTTVR